VKQFWLMTLTQIVPDSMDSRYYTVLKQNEALEEALQSNVYNFEAQDIADQINITRLREEGQLAEAAALEKLRLQRIRLHQQQQFQAETLARQKAMQEQLAALREEVAYLQNVAQQAANAANAARAEAQSRH
jgi:dynactin complex subunit